MFIAFIPGVVDKRFTYLLFRQVVFCFAIRVRVTPAVLITCWFHPTFWERYARMLVEPSYRRRLFGANPAIADKALKCVPPTAIWKATKAVGFAPA